MISIIGAGIAGLASAIALKQGQHNVQVFERTLHLPNIGAGVVLWPNAMLVLEQLGLAENIVKASGAVAAMNRYDQYNQSLGSLNINQINSLCGYQSRSILRSQLLDVLLAKAQSLDIEIHYGRDLQKIHCKSTRYKLVFKCGVEQVCDAVIGADGRMNSIVRKHLLGDNQPIYQNFINVIGTAGYKSEPGQLAVADYWGTGQRFGIVPISQQRAYWAAGWHSSERLNVAALSKVQLQGLLEQRFNCWPHCVQRLLKTVDAASLKAINIHDHNPCDYWSKGKVLMIGDAAHAALPTSGQGACQALEDAYWLAKMVGEYGLNSETFQRFYQFRITKTSAIINAGRVLAKAIFNPTASACKLRDAASKNTDFDQSAVAMAKFWMAGL